MEEVQRLSFGPLQHLMCRWDKELSAMQSEKEELVRWEEGQVSVMSKKKNPWETNISLWSLTVNALWEARLSGWEEKADREKLFFEEQSLDSEVRENKIWIQVLPFTRCVILGKSLKLSTSFFSCSKWI